MLDMDADPSKKFQGIHFVFLDRDGVINRKPAEDQTIYRWRDFDLLPGVESAIARLNGIGHKVMIVTNQRGIALGSYSEQDLMELHQQLEAHLRLHGAHVDAIYFCPHDRNECDCRKPGPAMFHQAFEDFPGATPANSVIIGDSISDIEAGIRLGMRTIFVEGDPAFQKPGVQKAAESATHTSSSLYNAVYELLTTGHALGQPSSESAAHHVTPS